MKKNAFIAVLSLGLMFFSANSAVAIKTDENILHEMSKSDAKDLKDTKNQYCSVMGFHEPNSNIYDGPTHCNRISLDNLTVRGPLELNHTSINGITEVSGPVTAISSHIQDLFVETQITQVKVVLKSGTVVKGNVTFKGKKGLIYLKDGSSIEGIIKNGNIIPD